MSFEEKRKPVLQAIMNHHGLLIGQEKGLSSEDMWNAIMSHIAVGHCAQSLAAPLPWSAQASNADTHPVCNDFAQDAQLQANDNDENQLKIIYKFLKKHPSSFTFCEDRIFLMTQWNLANDFV
jgi:hypothetical protein